MRVGSEASRLGRCGLLDGAVGEFLDHGGDACAVLKDGPRIGGKLGEADGDVGGDAEEAACAGEEAGNWRGGGFGLTEALLEQPEVFVILHAVAEILPADGADGIGEKWGVWVGGVGPGRVEEAAVAVAPGAALAGLEAVAGDPAHGVGPRILECGGGVGGGAVPVDSGPDEDAGDAVLPGLPGPEAELGGGVIDEEGEVGSFGDSAEVPPDFVACVAPGADLFRGPLGCEGAPGVDVAEQFGFGLFGEHALDAWRGGFEAFHAVDDEGVVLGVGFIEPVGEGFGEPAALAQMVFDLAEVIVEEAGVFGRSLGIACEFAGVARVEGAAAHAEQRQLKRVEPGLVEPMRSRLVEPGEVQVRLALSVSLGELHVDGREVVERIGADPVVGEALEVAVEDEFAVGRGDEAVMAVESCGAEAEGGAEMGFAGQVEIMDVNEDGDGLSAEGGVEEDEAAVLAGGGAGRDVECDPERLVEVGTKSERERERRERVRVQAGGGCLVRGLCDLDVSDLVEEGSDGGRFPVWVREGCEGGAGEARVLGGP